jgi:hypothetical protein
MSETMQSERTNQTQADPVTDVLRRFAARGFKVTFTGHSDGVLFITCGKEGVKQVVFGCMVHLRDPNVWSLAQEVEALCTHWEDEYEKARP